MLSYLHLSGIPFIAEPHLSERKCLQWMTNLAVGWFSSGSLGSITFFKKAQLNSFWVFWHGDLFNKGILKSEKQFCFLNYKFLCRSTSIGTKRFGVGLLGEPRLCCSKYHSSWSYPNKSYWRQFVGKKGLEKNLKNVLWRENYIFNKKDVGRWKINKGHIILHLPMTHLMVVFLLPIYASILL